ncbi:MAG: ATP-binding cassette domain-containing protein [Saprospiraceae bacterium]
MNQQDSNMVLSLDNVVKRYHNHLAVDHVSLDLPRGQIVGLLGPNGAGKTSLIRIINAITGADEGHVYFEGKPLTSDHVSEIGYMPEERGLYKKMKVGEQLTYLAQLKGLTKQQSQENLKYWLERFDIKSWWNKKIEELSKGMQQKIQFIATVVHKPKLLILDEPFSGLDPINTNLIKDEIYELNKQGTTVIFSTHRMEQVEEICEDIALINKGKMILIGSVAQIKEDYKENKYRLVTNRDITQYLEPAGVQIESQKENDYIVKFSDYNSNAFLSNLINDDIKIISFNEILPSINEIFIKKVNEN